MKEYKVLVNFGGFIGCDIEYICTAETEDEALEEAYQLAQDDLSAEIIEVEDEDEDENDDY